MALLAAYNFDGSGDTVTDHSGNGNDFSISGDAVSRQPGKNDLSLVYDPNAGSGTATPPLIGQTQHRSFVLWLTDLTDTNWPLQWDPGVWGFYYDGAINVRADNGSTIVDTTAAWPGDGAYHHVGATYDGSTVSVYIDGVLENTGSISGPLRTDATAVLLFHNTGSGEIDDLRIYDHALTETEIQEAMNTAVGGGSVGAATLTGIGGANADLGRRTLYFEDFVNPERTTDTKAGYHYGYGGSVTIDTADSYVGAPSLLCSDTDANSRLNYRSSGASEYAVKTDPGLVYRGELFYTEDTATMPTDLRWRLQFIHVADDGTETNVGEKIIVDMPRVTAWTRVNTPSMTAPADATLLDWDFVDGTGAGSKWRLDAVKYDELTTPTGTAELAGFASISATGTTDGAGTTGAAVLAGSGSLSATPATSGAAGLHGSGGLVVHVAAATHLPAVDIIGTAAPAGRKQGTASTSQYGGSAHA